MRPGLFTKAQIVGVALLPTLLMAGCPIECPPAKTPTAAMRTSCPRIGMDESTMYAALANWTNDCEAGLSKREVMLFRSGQCNTAGIFDPQLAADCQACVQAIADAVFGPG